MELLPNSARLERGFSAHVFSQFAQNLLRKAETPQKKSYKTALGFVLMRIFDLTVFILTQQKIIFCSESRVNLNHFEALSWTFQ